MGVDAVMAATGRQPNTNGLGLEAVGVKTDAEGAVVVNEYSRRSVENIYAVGDVTNHMNLTQVASREGHAIADTVFGTKTRSMGNGNETAGDRTRVGEGKRESKREE